MSYIVLHFVYRSKASYFQPAEGVIYIGRFGAWWLWICQHEKIKSPLWTVKMSIIVSARGWLTANREKMTVCVRQREIDGTGDFSPLSHARIQMDVAVWSKWNKCAQKKSLLLAFLSFVPLDPVKCIPSFCLCACPWQRVGVSERACVSTLTWPRCRTGWTSLLPPTAKCCCSGPLLLPRPSSLPSWLSCYVWAATGEWQMEHWTHKHIHIYSGYLAPFIFGTLFL